LRPLLFRRDRCGKTFLAHGMSSTAWRKHLLGRNSCNDEIASKCIAAENPRATDTTLRASGKVLRQVSV
jgi:hypothetical protein